MSFKIITAGYKKQDPSTPYIFEEGFTNKGFQLARGSGLASLPYKVCKVKKLSKDLVEISVPVWLCNKTPKFFA